MAGPTVHFHLPRLSIFKFPPDPDPLVLPPPSGASRFAAPFPIDAKLYNDLLSPYIPLTIATIYAITVLAVNKINRDRGFKPYWISTTRPFFAFVLIHNVFLAIFSALVFVGMLRALRHSWPSHREYEAFGILWPGLRTQNGLAGAADALCKMHGPRGFGDAVAYNAGKKLWEVKNRLIRLNNGLPDTTDVGRLWNEGLAFWGWFFYLSKFYEVVDTAIILLKGKRSSTLQMYHHAGAMLCMWAGIRYMSPPIWMFCFINSGIHALMYVYYTLSALGVRVPRRVKKSLTTMQIGQFIVGFTFAAGHLFVSYTIPSSAIYAGKYGFKAASSVASVASAVSSVVVDGSLPTATAGIGAALKKLAFRAAGQEGLAENVRNSWGEVFGAEGDYVQDTLSRMERQKSSFETIECIDTTGESFAIWLNLFYLAPLTWLFLRFFIKSYSKRTSSATGQPTHRRKLSESASDAARDVDRELESWGRSAEDGLGEIAKKGRRTADNRRISETIEKFEKGVGKGYDEAIKQGKDLSEKAKREAGRISDGIAEKVGRWNGSGEGSTTPQKVKEYAQSLLNRGTDDAKKADDEAKSVVDEAGEKASEAKEDAQEKAGKAKGKAEEKTEESKEEVEEKTNDVKEGSDEKAGEAKEEAEEEANGVKEQGDEKEDKVKQEGEDSKSSSPQDSGVLVERDEEPAPEDEDEDEDEKQRQQDGGSQKQDEEPPKQGPEKKEDGDSSPQDSSTADPEEEGVSDAEKVK